MNEAAFHGYRRLRSGDLDLLYARGEIRQIRVGNIQVVNSIYSAVRDRNWGTIPFETVDEILEERDDGFSVRLEMESLERHIPFCAVVHYESCYNTLVCSFEGAAMSAFLRNRIGWCILHPLKECRGQQAEIIHPDGTRSTGSFPKQINPHQPFLNMAGIRWNPHPDMEAELMFEGDIFEMEDQRNWTDASFKTYGTPLEKPFPVQVKAGTEIKQTITLKVQLKKPPGQSIPDEVHTLTVEPNIGFPFPGIGIGRSSENTPLSSEESEMLREIPFGHYRVDLQLSDPGWEDTLLKATKEQKQLGWPLELVLYIGDDPMGQVEHFIDTYKVLQLPLKHMVLFHKNPLSDQQVFKQVIPGLKKAFPGILIGGGTDDHFAELNRNPPDADLFDFIAYSICPQVHAFDNLTLLENLEAQSETVSSAKEMFGKPVSIPAITLRQRFNPADTDQAAAGSPQYLLSDPRQDSLFAAGWTLGSIQQLALAGASTLTYYETVGSRGIMDRSERTRKRYPLYYLFKALIREESGQLFRTFSSHPLKFNGLMTDNGSTRQMFVANYTDTEQLLEIKGTATSPTGIGMLTGKGWKEISGPYPDLREFVLQPLGLYQISFSV